MTSTRMKIHNGGGTFEEYVESLNREPTKEIKLPYELRRAAGSRPCLDHPDPSARCGCSDCAASARRWCLHQLGKLKCRCCTGTPAAAAGGGGTGPTAPPMSRLELAASKRNFCSDCVRPIYEESVKQAAADAMEAPTDAPESSTASAEERAQAAKLAAIAAAARDAAAAAVAATKKWVDKVVAATEKAATEAPGSLAPAPKIDAEGVMKSAAAAAATTAARVAAKTLRVTDAKAAATEAATAAAMGEAAAAVLKAANQVTAAVSKEEAAAAVVTEASVAAAAMAATTIIPRTLPASPAYDSGDTALHYVARSGNLELLCHLITLIAKEDPEQGRHARVIAFLRKHNARGETVLHEAIMSGNKGMVEVLMWVDPRLAEFPAADGQATSPLYLAITLGHEKIVGMLTEQSLNRNNIPCFGPDEQNGLHAAVFHGKGMTEAVLGRDWMSINLGEETDNNGSTPLHFVVSVVVHYFRMWGVRVCRKRWVPKLPIRTVLNLNGPSAAHNCCTSILFSVAATVVYCFRICGLFLREKLCDPKHPTRAVLNVNDQSAAYKKDKQGLYPVHVAAKMNSVDAVRIMFEKCPCCAFLRDGNGRTFLHTAVEHGSLSVVRYARATSIAASVLNARDKVGNTALHRAVWVGNLSVFYALMLEKGESLNLRNDKNQTPLDVARCMISGGLLDSRNPENLIHRTLKNAGGKNSSIRWDRFDNTNRPKQKPEDREKSFVEIREEDEEKKAPKLTDSARSLGICSALIASVTFSVTFAVLAGLKSANGKNGGTPVIFGTWYFNAFVMANTLAFIYSLIATVSVMYSGMSVFKSVIRSRHIQASAYLVRLSLTCLSAAFALGLYTVRAPLGHKTTAVFSSFVLIAAVPMTRGMDYKNFSIVTRIMWTRRGFWFACRLVLWGFIRSALLDFWPMIPIAGWAVYSTRYLVKQSAAQA